MDANRFKLYFYIGKNPQPLTKQKSPKITLLTLPRQHYIKDCYTCFGTVYPNLTRLLVSSKEYPKIKCQEELMLRVLPIGKIERED